MVGLVDGSPINSQFCPHEQDYKGAVVEMTAERFRQFFYCLLVKLNGLEPDFVAQKCLSLGTFPESLDNNPGMQTRA